LLTAAPGIHMFKGESAFGSWIDRITAAAACTRSSGRGACTWRRYSEGYGVGVVIERTCARPGRDQGVT